MAVALPLFLVSLASCASAGGSGGGSGGCQPTEISVEPVEVTDERANVTFTAKLTADGEPLAGKRVHFAVVLEKDDVFVQIDDGKTDEDGVATVTQRGGIGERLMNGDTAVKYVAEFDSWEKEKDGPQYCEVEERAELSCNGGGCEALEPPDPEL